jgi:hypothetical protein
MFLSAFNFPQYRFDFEGLNFDCTAPALFLGPDSLQTPSGSFGLASNGCPARQFCAHDKRATPRGLQICPTPLVVSGRNWSRMRRLTPKSGDGFPQHRVDATSVSSKSLNRADRNLQPSISIAINCPLPKRTL